jgi:hypothetical protein
VSDADRVVVFNTIKYTSSILKMQLPRVSKVIIVDEHKWRYVIMADRTSVFDESGGKLMTFPGATFTGYV